MAVATAVTTYGHLALTNLSVPTPPAAALAFVLAPLGGGSCRARFCIARRKRTDPVLKRRACTSSNLDVSVATRGHLLSARGRSLVRSGEVGVVARKEVSALTTRSSSSASARRWRRSPTSRRRSCCSSLCGCARASAAGARFAAHGCLGLTVPGRDGAVVGEGCARVYEEFSECRAVC